MNNCLNIIRSSALFILLTCCNSEFNQTYFAPFSGLHTIDPYQDNILGVPIDSNYAQIFSNFDVVEFGKFKRESEYYDFIVIKIDGEIRMRIEFSGSSSDDQSKVRSFELNSRHVRDVVGIGVGDTLNELEQAWPGGHLLYGYTDERYTIYSTSAGLMFDLDPNRMNSSCYEPMAECEVPRDIGIVNIVFVPSLRRNTPGPRMLRGHGDTLLNP